MWREFEPKAQLPRIGRAHLCFLTTIPLAGIYVHLSVCGAAIEEGPVARSGALGSLARSTCATPTATWSRLPWMRW